MFARRVNVGEAKPQVKRIHAVVEVTADLPRREKQVSDIVMNA